MRTPIKAMIDWTTKTIESIEDDADVQWTKYVGWPSKVLRCMQASVAGNKGLTFGDVRDMVRWDPGALKEGRAGTKVNIPKGGGQTVAW